MVEEKKNSHKNKNNNDRKRKKDNNEKKMERPEASEACTAEKQPSKKKNRKEVAIFGNYRNYYGYRVGQDLEEDPRLKVMKREWFEDKNCLDIGCNSGLITINLAKKFNCRSILGVDIDGGKTKIRVSSYEIASSSFFLIRCILARIEDAYWTLRKVMKTITHKPASDNATEEKHNDFGDSSPKDLLKIVSFQKGNFVQNWRSPANTHYHAILCLSVSKWIHLNWGDDGLITLFWKVWNLLQPGGVFILEPQPWSSYYNNRQVSETAAENYKNIEITPEDFQDILLYKIGFRRVENITSGLSGSKAGFDRPILAFWK